MSPAIDLRHEPALSGEHMTRSGESRYDDLITGALLRDGPWLSANARTQLQEMVGSAWIEPLKLADRIEDGGAFENDAEHDLLYESYPDLIDTVIDLFNMVSRRDEQIAALESQLDEVAAYAIDVAEGIAARDALIDFAGSRRHAQAKAKSS